MTPVSVLIVVVLVVQGTSKEPAVVSVRKEEAAPYRTAVRKLEEAHQMMGRREWKPAEECLTRIIDDSGIKVRECRLKLQQSDSTWAPAAEFFPVYARATARLELALECLDGKDPFAAAPWVRGAAADVGESVASRVPGSDALAARIAAAVHRIGRVAEIDAVEDGALVIPRSHAARYRQAVERVRASEDALRKGEVARALLLAHEACVDDDIPERHLERTLLLRDRPVPERVEFRPFRARGHAALAQAKMLSGSAAREAARTALESHVESRRRGTPGLDGEIADAEALLAAAETPPEARGPAEVPPRPKGPVWPALAMAGGVLAAALVVLSRWREATRL